MHPRSEKLKRKIIMKFKAVKIIGLLVAVLGASQMTLAEEMPESPRQKEARIEKGVNVLFERAVKGAALKLNNKENIYPYAIILKKDGRLGFFELDLTTTKKQLSVTDMALSVRRYLSELAVADQIDASVLIMYATVQAKGEKPAQGLTFEIEHTDGVSLMRFLPVTEDKENEKLILHTESMTTSIKPVTVFTDMVKAIVKNK